MTSHIPAAAVSAALTLLGVTRRQRLVTLIYHRVRTVRDPMFPGEVTADDFSWQIEMVSRYCHPLPLREAVARLRAGTLPSRAVAVTFDDGYRDNATTALPLLRRHGVPATFFVATSFLGGGMMWNDAVIEALRATSLTSIALAGIDLPAQLLDDPTSRGRAAASILHHIKHRPQAERQRIAERIVELCQVHLPRDLMMTEAQVRSLHAAGMEVGAHTHTHPILCTLEPQAVREEMAGSRDALELLTGAPVVGFAYPNGRPGEDYGPRERRIVEELGFEYAVATRWGASTSATDRFQLPRFTPWDGTPGRWLARLLLQFRKAT